MSDHSPRASVPSALALVEQQIARSFEAMNNAAYGVTRGEVTHVVVPRQEMFSALIAIRAAVRELAASLAVVPPPQEKSMTTTSLVDLYLHRELCVYLDTQDIHGDNIGDIRRDCFVPWDSQWNGIVRDETAERERHGGAVVPPPDLPSVAGRLDRPIADFERSCLVHLHEEQPFAVVPSQETTKDDLHQQIMNLPTQIQKYTKDIDNSGTWIDGYLIGHRDARHAAAELASAALAVVGEATPQPEPTQIDQFNSQDADLPRS